MAKKCEVNIFGIFIDRIDDFREVINESIVFIILVSLWILSVFVSIFYCFKCIIPQIETKYDKNVFFFKDAAHAYGTIKEYSKKLMDVCKNHDELFAQLSEQIHIESKIVDRKFENIHKSIKFFVLSIILVALIILFYFIRS